MSNVNNERIAHEAVESVAARPPADSDDRIQGAMQRYLGSALFEALRPQRRRTDRKQSGGGEHTDGS